MISHHPAHRGSGPSAPSALALSPPEVLPGPAASSAYARPAQVPRWVEPVRALESAPCPPSGSQRWPDVRGRSTSRDDQAEAGRRGAVFEETEVVEVLRRRSAAPAGSGPKASPLWVILGAILLVLFIGDGLILSAVDAGRPALGVMGWATPVGDLPSATTSAEPPSPPSSAGPAASPVAAVTAAASIGVVGSWGIPDGWRYAGLRCVSVGGAQVITRVYSPPRWFGPPGAGGTWAVWSGLDLPGRRVVLASAFDGNEASFAIEWADGEVTVTEGPALAFPAFTSGSGRVNELPDRIRELLETAPVNDRCQAL